MKIKTNELQGKALDYAVAKREGVTFALWNGAVVDEFSNPLIFSDDWGLAGPIIEREQLGVWAYQWNEDGEPEVGWYAEDKDGGNVRKGDTPLVAAMRCYVASQLGDEVEIPDELKGDE